MGLNTGAATLEGNFCFVYEGGNTKERRADVILMACSTSLS